MKRNKKIIFNWKEEGNFILDEIFQEVFVEVVEIYFSKRIYTICVGSIEYYI